MDDRSLMTLCAVTLDCPNALALAAFYQQATGLATAEGSGEEFTGLRAPGGLFIGFQRVKNYRPPEWPDQLFPQQLHLDFEVDDLDAAEKILLEMGATKPQVPSGGESWRVLLDPAGHPFCLTTSKTVRN